MKWSYQAMKRLYHAMKRPYRGLKRNDYGSPDKLGGLCI